MAGVAAFELMKRLNAGGRLKEPLAAPNLWRMKASARLAWATPAEARQPVRELLDFRDRALAIGENSTPSSEALINFGAPPGEELLPGEATAMRAGFQAAAVLGAPCESTREWTFGG